MFSWQKVVGIKFEEKSKASAHNGDQDLDLVICELLLSLLIRIPLGLSAAGTQK